MKYLKIISDNNAASYVLRITALFLVLCISSPQMYPLLALSQANAILAEDQRPRTPSSPEILKGMVPFNVMQQANVVKLVMGPGQYFETRSWIGAATVDPSDTSLYLKVWWEVEGETASWFNIRPNPVRIGQGEKKWIVITIKAPRDAKVGYHEGVIRGMYAWFNDKGQVSKVQELGTSRHVILIDPRPALLKLIDDLEYKARGALRAHVRLSAEAMALYAENFDVDWFQNMVVLGLTIADILSPDPSKLGKMPVWLIRLGKVLKWVNYHNRAYTAYSLWGEFSKWMKSPDMPKEYSARVRFFYDKIMNEMPVNFEIQREYPGGHEFSIRYHTRGLAALDQSISGFCEKLRSRVKGLPDDKLDALTTAYPLIVEFVTRYTRYFSTSKYESVVVPKYPYKLTQNIESPDYTSVWNFGNQRWMYKSIFEIIKLREKASSWTWTSIFSGAGGTLLGAAGSLAFLISGLSTGGVTWMIGGSIVLGGLSGYAAHKATRYQVRADEAAIGLNTLVGLTLMTGEGGARDITGCLFDLLGFMEGVLTEVELRAQGSTETTALYDYAPFSIAVESPKPVGEVISLSTPDVIIPEGEEMGSGTGSITIRNNGALEARVTGLVTVYAPIRDQDRVLALSSFSLPSVKLAPGETRTLKFSYYGPASSWWGASYLVEALVTLITKDDCFSLAPAISSFYVGTQEEISSLRQKENVILEGIMDFSGTSIERTFTISPDTISFSLVLMDSGGDFDLHLYDEYGNHVGFDYAGNHTEIGIPGATYTGRSSYPERITISSVSSRAFTLKVVGVRSVVDERYKVLLVEVPARSPILTVIPTSIQGIGSPGDRVEAELFIQEIGGSQGESISIEAEGDIKDWIQISDAHLNVMAGGTASVQLEIDIPPYAQPGVSYNGYIVVSPESSSRHRISVEVIIIGQRGQPITQSLQVVSVNYPSTVKPGDTFVVEVKVSYAFLRPTSVFIGILDVDAEEYLPTEPMGIFEINGNGTTTITLRLKAPPDEGVLHLSADAYYKQGDQWVHQEEGWYQEFEVQVSECLIATATYGSELSPEVQFLRDFRDHVVLCTFTGRQFMIAFNTVYYSFSPTVASVISSSEVMRNIMRGLLYPLMAILHLGSIVYSFLSFSPDAGIMAFCLVVSSLMGVVYMVPWLLLLNFFRRISIPQRVIKILSLIWMTSIGVISLAEIFTFPLLMMIGGVVFVITTAFLAMMIATEKIIKYLPLASDLKGVT